MGFFIVIPIIFELIFALAVFFIIAKIIKTALRNRSANRTESSHQNTISNANDPDSYGNSLSSEPTDVCCAYCGTKYNKMKKRCPSCGASKSDEK